MLFPCLLLVFYNFLLLSLSKQGLTGIHTHTAEQGNVEELLYLGMQSINTIPNLPFLLSKISRLLVLCSLCAIWRVRGVGPFPLSHVSPSLCSADGAGTGEMPSQAPHPCASSEFCSKVHQIYFIPSYTPLGSSCNPAF